MGEGCEVGGLCGATHAFAASEAIGQFVAASVADR
jgi:hypothetical protein